MRTHQAKMNMLRQQIRTWHVINENVLNIIKKLPREDFVPAKYRRLAFADMQIPLLHDQTMMSPCVEARILDVLNIQAKDKILEIGTGTGYMTAALAKMAQHVYSVDIYADFLESAEQRLQTLKIDNVSFQEGNGAEGWDKQQPYDVICVTGSLPILPKTFREQLAIGGRLFAIIGKGPAMEAILIERVNESNWSEISLFETEITPLLNAVEPEQFSF